MTASLVTCQLRIVSDGRSIGTQVFMPDGTPLRGVQRIEIEPIAVGDMVRATITVIGPSLDIVANVPETEGETT
jgi:hypothetical protein